MTTLQDYKDQGYASRKDYLKGLADDLGIPASTVYAMASMLGPDEDFDGLVTALEDYAEDFDY